MRKGSDDLFLNNTSLKSVSNNLTKLIIVLLSSIILCSCSIGKETEGESTDSIQITEETKDTAAEKNTTTEASSSTETVEKDESIKHFRIEKKIGGFSQSINIIEFKQESDIRVKAVFSHDRIFGFQKLSEMIRGKDCYAAINGGFYSVYGRPYGMVAVDGEFYTDSKGKFPAFVFENNRYRLEILDINFWIENNGRKTHIDKINDIGLQDQTVLYTRRFGSDNRTNTDSINILISGGVIQDVFKAGEKVKIPETGYLVSLFNKDEKLYQEWQERIGEAAEFKNSSGFNNSFQIYECGSWLLTDGEITAPDYDGYIGTLMNREPRTAIGIKENGNVVLITADGRQPGFATGFTAKELAAFLKGYGVQDAAMLDGGSSTEMIIENEIINSLSYNGRERLIAGGLMIKSGE